jgi:hypothetical protein
MISAISLLDPFKRHTPANVRPQFHPTGWAVDVYQCERGRMSLSDYTRSGIKRKEAYELDPAASALAINADLIM